MEQKSEIMNKSQKIRALFRSSEFQGVIVFEFLKFRYKSVELTALSVATSSEINN